MALLPLIAWVPDLTAAMMAGNGAPADEPRGRRELHR